MKVFRWLMVVPGAILALMIGSLSGGIALSIFRNQALTDAGSAFFGCFALAFAAGLIAPSKRVKTTIVFACIIACTAVLSFVITVVTNLEPLSSRTTLAKVLVPVAQILGALYALFLFPPVVIPNAKLQDEINYHIVGLGGFVFFFGILVSLVGLTVGLLGYSWVGLITGLGVITLGISTYIFPFIHPLSRMPRFNAELRQMLKDEKQAKFERSFSKENNTTDDADARYNLGIAYGKLGRHQDAIESYNQAIRIKPDYAEVHFNLGLTYLIVGDKGSVLEEYEILKTLDTELANKLFILIYK